MQEPKLDPTVIFDHFRANFGSDILTAAITHFNLFNKFRENGPQSEAELQHDLGLADRPWIVLVTALRAMKLLEKNNEGKLQPSALAYEFLIPETYFDMSSYMDLGRDNPSVKRLIDIMVADHPTGSQDESSGSEYTFSSDDDSVMSDPKVARLLTLALAGRARACAPYLARHSKLEPGQTILDIGGGSGIYAFGFLDKYPGTTAIILDAPEVLSVAEEIANEHGFKNRISLQEGDMFTDSLPPADITLLSNILHDWDIPECKKIIQNCSANMPSGGKLLIHDVFLNENMDGPIEAAFYSIALMTITKGRAYGISEYRGWCEAAGLSTQKNILSTLVHCNTLIAEKS